MGRLAKSAVFRTVRAANRIEQERAMSRTELFLVVLILALGFSGIVARYFWARYREDEPRATSPVTTSGSNMAFFLGIFALIAMFAKPSAWPVANSIMLAIIAVIFAFAVSEKLRGR